MYLPLANILSTSTIDCAIFRVDSIPESIGFLTSPNDSVDAIPPTESIAPKVTTAFENFNKASPTDETHSFGGNLSYFPVEIILSVSTIFSAIFNVAASPAAIAIAPSPNVPTINPPSVTAASPNPIIDAPTPVIHFRPGNLLNVPIEIILSTNTIVPAMASIDARPAKIASAPTPVIAIVPSTSATNPNPTTLAPTPNIHFKLGYLSYVPRDTINDVNIIVVAIAKVAIPPLTISVSPIFNFFNAHKVPAIAIVVTPSAIENPTNLNI